jgi:GNAT superfamily N-acetyltransferase
MSVVIAALTEVDRAEWEPLARGYMAFYRENPPNHAYDDAWQRILAAETVHGIGAKRDGRLVGIAHYLFQPHVWAGTVCYLQDLFTAPEARGQGVARALIEAVAAATRARDVHRLYWLTQEDNATARTLYDRVAAFHGFIRYDYPL